MHERRKVEEALALLAAGATPTEVSRRLGTPRSTIMDWSTGRGLHALRVGDAGVDPTSCSWEAHAPELNLSRYAYLLGMYLGDGCVSQYARGVTRVRLTLDAIYPEIVAECVDAIEAVVPRKRAHVLARRGERCLGVSAYWKHWPCLFPQHVRLYRGWSTLYPFKRDSDLDLQTGIRESARRVRRAEALAPGSGAGTIRDRAEHAGPDQRHSAHEYPGPHAHRLERRIRRRFLAPCHLR